jgi:UDP-GlcNAc:undecaprenyl-phosphate GlcNAc-1-phosphate transferase
MVYLIVFAASLLLSLILIPIIRKIMLKLGVLNIPGEDRWNKNPIALMGGIGIFISFAVAGLLRLEFNRELIIVLLGGLVIFILGILDDRVGTHFKTKFAVQLLVAVGVVSFGVSCKILPYQWANIFITIFWIVGLTNALNFLDNMDGVSSGIAIVASLFILGLTLLKGQTNNVALLSSALAGSCLGFLRYNFNPASIFMGDCGSLLLGYMLAVLAIIGGWQHSSPLAGAFLSPILTMGVAIFDTTLVTILRLKHGRMPWQGGKDHSSHRLVSILNGSERGAVLILYGLGIAAGALGLIVSRLDSWIAILITMVFFLGLVVFGIRLARVECYKNK